jgi:hypothetical protein
MQFEAWADSQYQAWTIIAQVQKALFEIPQVHALGVVTYAATVRGPAYMPDPDTNKQRYSLDAQVFLHPTI